MPMSWLTSVDLVYIRVLKVKKYMVKADCVR